MILNQNNCLIMIIDIQEKLLNAVFNKEILEKNASIWAKSATTLNIPVLITEQYPKGLGNTNESIKNSIENAKYYEKSDFNALTNTEVSEELAKSNKKQIILFGIETHICVYQTVTALIQAGYDVVVINNACGSRNAEEHSLALKYMEKLGAHIKTTEMALFELLKSSKHHNFKEIQSLIK